MKTNRTSQRIAVLVLLLAGLGVLAAAGAARADTCTCDLYLYSHDRWMSPWWGLECNEHCGHGYVGSSCDTAHGTGCGAMTGFVRFRYSNGNTIRNLYCPDDHYTCFRGPSACDDGGSWGNTCSADIEHCVPGGSGDGTFDCNYLSDPSWVYQLSATGVRFSGACGTNWFNVYESIDENDPWCCDDPMGTFNVSSYTAEGFATAYLYPGYQNCNGGSQGGVYPHCGLFGASLVVDMSCYTTRGGLFSSAAAAEGGPPVAEQREALAASLARRARQMAESPREPVVVEVAERARALGVSAPVEALTGLLIQAGVAGLERDDCGVREGEDAARCRETARALDRLDAEFRKLSGFTLQEFRSGSPLLGPPPPPVVPGRTVRSSEP